jgi:hypothetical protein
MVAYGAETWTMTKKEEEALLIFEIKTWNPQGLSGPVMGLFYLYSSLNKNNNFI